MTSWTTFYFVINVLFLIYAITISLSYLILAIISVFEMRRYIRHYKVVEI